MEIKTPKLPSRCQVCHHEKRFELQKAIDDGGRLEELSQKYNIPISSIQYHNKVGHRTDLLTWGYADYSIRKNAKRYDEINSQTICEMTKKCLEAAKRMSPDDFKPGDVTKFIEFMTKLSGEMVDKHEVTMKQDLGTKIREFLDVDETKTS